MEYFKVCLPAVPNRVFSEKQSENEMIRLEVRTVRSISISFKILDVMTSFFSMRTLDFSKHILLKMAEEDSDFLAATSNALWDPLYSKDWDKENVTPQCVLRIKR